MGGRIVGHTEITYVTTVRPTVYQSVISELPVIRLEPNCDWGMIVLTHTPRQPWRPGIWTHIKGEFTIHHVCIMCHSSQTSIPASSAPPNHRTQP